MFPFVVDFHHAEEAFLPRDWDLGASRVTLEYGLQRLGEPMPVRRNLSHRRNGSQRLSERVDPKRYNALNYLSNFRALIIL